MRTKQTPHAANPFQHLGNRGIDAVIGKFAVTILTKRAAPIV